MNSRRNIHRSWRFRHALKQQQPRSGFTMPCHVHLCGPGAYFSPFSIPSFFFFHFHTESSRLLRVPVQRVRICVRASEKQEIRFPLYYVDSGYLVNTNTALLDCSIYARKNMHTQRGGGRRE